MSWIIVLYCLGEDTAHQQQSQLQNPGLLPPWRPTSWPPSWVPSARFDIQIYPCPSVFFSVSGGRCLETTFLKHTCWLLADTARRLAGREAIYSSPGVAVSGHRNRLCPSNFGGSRGGKSGNQCLQQSPAVYQSVQACGHGSDLQQLSGLWDLLYVPSLWFPQPLQQISCGKFLCLNYPDWTTLSQPFCRHQNILPTYHFFWITLFSTVYE